MTEAFISTDALLGVVLDASTIDLDVHSGVNRREGGEAARETNLSLLDSTLFSSDSQRRRPDEQHIIRSS